MVNFLGTAGSRLATASLEWATHEKQDIERGFMAKTPLFDHDRFAKYMFMILSNRSEGARHGRSHNGAKAWRRHMEHHAVPNKFERFRGFLELISRFEFDFRRCGIF